MKCFVFVLCCKWSIDELKPHYAKEMKIGWKIVVGSIIGFLGAACGVVGGVGGGGIFVAMLNLIIGFDTKSSIAISKCKTIQPF